LWIGAALDGHRHAVGRASGWTAPQSSGDRPRIARMLGEVAEHFSTLVTVDASPWTAEVFERQIGARFDKVIEHANVLSTVTRLKRLRAEMRERMVGQRIPLVIYHADLRAKHVQIDRDGRVLAILDWGTAEVEGPPYYDLLQLFVHERKQEDGLSPEQAWRIVRERRELRDEERAALDGYVEAIGLDPDVARAFEAMYPVLVAAMAETHWDFSRPRWLHKQFGM
jgi:aminoglycoside phosphotransferase (APT) family kinase protein